MSDFDLLGKLPTGTTVLEASAGTGKTFTIAGLVARYVAEGVATLDEMLVVTFGRAATHELRERVRERLVSARDGLADPAAALASGDEVLRHLAATDVEARRRRLAEALANFDAATVATTHQFCQQVLTSLGTAGDVDRGAVLVDNLDDLVVEVAEDFYLRKYGNPTADEPDLTVTDALAIARCAVNDGQALLEPVGADGVAGVRQRFGTAVRAEVDRRKRSLKLLGFDDLLTRLAQALHEPAAQTRLRRRYKIVLVDEFQDTDPVQWDILRLAFHGHATVVLIGDPKQAIYAFRGADVHAYLHAAHVAGARATLTTNWRSDPLLLEGLVALFRGSALGDPRIVVGPVQAAYGGESLIPVHPRAPVRLRVLARDGFALGKTGFPAVGEARSAIAEDVAADIVGLVSGGADVLLRKDSSRRPVEPGDIAVLVRTNAQAELVRGCLQACGVPSVLRGTSSVFGTEAATEWLILLEALEQPHRVGRVRRLALTNLIGLTAAALADTDTDALALRLRDWAALLEDRGVAALFEAVSRSEELSRRVLGKREGERLMTDLRHVGEALHAAALDGQLGLAALLGWLRRRVDEAAGDQSQERSRRLDSDAAAVQVVTIHASKGLEFPVVYVPFGWDRFVKDADTPLFHDDAGRRVRDIGGPTGPTFRNSVARNRSEELGEDLRLLYVAVTRAQGQLNLWWAPTATTPSSPLHRLLFSDDLPELVKVPNDDQSFAVLAGFAGPGLAVEPMTPGAPVRWSPPAAAVVPLSAAVFHRSIDTDWRRTSYSALTAAAHDAPSVSSEPELQAKDDEVDVAAVDGVDDPALRLVPSPMAELVGGAVFGTLVHAVLEDVDTALPDLAAELESHAQQQILRAGSILNAGILARALLPAMETPVVGRLRLRDIRPRDRLSELDFELPLVGGGKPGPVLRLGDLVPLLRAHLGASDPLFGYADRLDVPELRDAPLRGYLSGSIDAVLRVDGRFLVVDYKTNRLADRDEALTAWHYRPAAMATAMMNAHYPLQALLYAVALHRYLRWRLAGYDPDAHLGGVLYLFLRGMSGPDVLCSNGSAPGVFFWQPPAALIAELSDLLASGPRP